MHRMLTLFKNNDGEVVAKQEHSQDERIKRAMLALAIFRGQNVSNYADIAEDQLDELQKAAMQNKGHWTTFCVDDILSADSRKLLAFQSIYKQIMGNDSSKATGDDMLNATFPSSGMGVPWGHNNDEIIDRFPSTSSILYSRGFGW